MKKIKDIWNKLFTNVNANEIDWENTEPFLIEKFKASYNVQHEQLNERINFYHKKYIDVKLENKNYEDEIQNLQKQIKTLQYNYDKILMYKNNLLDIIKTLESNVRI
jgi:peptidoglycan hydrolase CwlO-like protein